jgi:membrane-bound ClpP family serine protease
MAVLASKPGGRRSEEVPAMTEGGDLQGKVLAAALGPAEPQGKAGSLVPELRHVILAKRLSLVAGVAGLSLVVGLVVSLALLASAALPWVVGAVLVLAVLGAAVAGIHAGGHGLLVPVPVVVLAAAWGLVVASTGWASPGAWAFAALAFVCALFGALLVLPAIAFRESYQRFSPRGTLVGATGVALSPLAPRGIVKVKNETWTAESLSGPLPAGATVHVARAEGVRLFVWSEAGRVPGLEAVDPTQH